MLFAFQILPLALYTFVAFHLWHSLSPFKSITVILLDKIGKDQGIGSLGTILRQYTYQE